MFISAVGIEMTWHILSVEAAEDSEMFSISMEKHIHLTFSGKKIHHIW